MKHIKTFRVFEWNIPGDAVGDPKMMMQNPRIPDTVPLRKEENIYRGTKKKKKTKRIYKK
jgi:hypothetical protein